LGRKRIAQIAATLRIRHPSPSRSANQARTRRFRPSVASSRSFRSSAVTSDVENVSTMTFGANSTNRLMTTT